MIRVHQPLSIKLRLVQVYYALIILIGLSYAALINPKTDLGFVYDLSMVRAIVQMSTSAQAIWMIQRRAKGTPLFCMVTTIICAVLSFIDIFFMHANAPVFAAIGIDGSAAIITVEYLLAALVVTYLWKSTEAKRVFTVDLNDEPEGPGNSWDAAGLRRRIRTWPFWRDLTIYFIVFSFLGHWAEMLFCRLIVAGVFMGGYDPTNAMLWDQWLFPFSAEGTALAMVVLFLFPLKQRLLRYFKGDVLRALLCSFLANAAICTLIDFFTGITCNQHYELWDYRDMPFNFMGQVCLQNSLVYSLAATLIVWVVYPLMDRGLRKLPRSFVDALFFNLLGFYAFEAALHFIVI